jgi:hypothetical protein
MACTGVDEVRDVGDVHPHLEVAVRELDAVQRVVEVARRRRVDRADAQLPQIAAHRELLRRHEPLVVGAGREAGQRRRRERALVHLPETKRVNCQRILTLYLF